MRQRNFQVFFGSIWETFWAPKGVNNGAQVGSRSDPNRRRKRRCEKKRFKIVLGRSWGGLGAVLERSWPNLRPSWDDLEAAGGSKFIVFPYVFRYFMKFLLFAPKWSPWPVWEPSWGLLARTCGLLERTWTDFGAQDVPKGTPKGTQEAPKKSPK